MASDREVTLGDVGRRIWRGKWYVVVVTILGALIALALTFTGCTKYTATSQVYLGQATTMMGNLASTPGSNPLTAATIAAGLALVPIALGMGKPGSEIQAPMAIVIFCGLVSSTALNMVVVPAALVAAISK